MSAKIAGPAEMAVSALAAKVAIATGGVQLSAPTRHTETDNPVVKRRKLISRDDNLIALGTNTP